MSAKTQSLIKDNNARWVDLRFTDTNGKEQHVTFPSHSMGPEAFEDGKMFDGSSIHGWKGIEASDMILMPDDSTAVMDPFTDEPTIIVRCDVIEPSTMQGYGRDPRSIARRAEEYLKSTGIADTAFFGPEPEFFIFDGVQWKNEMQGVSFQINSEEGAWATNADMDGANLGHRPRVKAWAYRYSSGGAHNGLATGRKVSHRHLS